VSFFWSKVIFAEIAGAGGMVTCRLSEIGPVTGNIKQLTIHLATFVALRQYQHGRNILRT
jgi:hypothetical protein